MKRYLTPLFAQIMKFLRAEYETTVQTVEWLNLKRLTMWGFGEDVRHLSTHTLLMESSTLGNSLAISLNVKNAFTIQPRHSTPRWNENICRKTFTWKSVAALFIHNSFKLKTTQISINSNSHFKVSLWKRKQTSWYMFLGFCAIYPKQAGSRGKRIPLKRFAKVTRNLKGGNAQVSDLSLAFPLFPRLPALCLGLIVSQRPDAAAILSPPSCNSSVPSGKMRKPLPKVLSISCLTGQSWITRPSPVHSAAKRKGITCP